MPNNLIALSPFVLLAVGLLGGAANRTADWRPQQSGRLVVRLPSEWIPFSATIVYNDPPGTVRRGRFYRGSDGSNTTIDQSRDGTPVITIHHYPSRQTFARLGQRGWIVYPFDKGQNTGPRLQLSAASSKLRPLDRLIAGQPVYEFTRSTGVAHLAAGLNGFAVYLQETDGRTIEFTDIVIGQPPAEVFAPPPGAQPVPMKRDEVLAPIKR
jgi:hypothetical protein